MNNNIIISRKKLKEKNIQWVEKYTEKTIILKRMFNDILGPGSYYRFEGKSTIDNTEYYSIIGVAKVRDPIAKFFAGAKKLPATYNIGGKYFDSLDKAMSYAHDTWGIPWPKDLRPYNTPYLNGIKERAIRWQEKNNLLHIDLDDPKKEENNTKIKKKKIKKQVHKLSLIDETIDDLIKIAEIKNKEGKVDQEKEILKLIKKYT